MAKSKSEMPNSRMRHSAESRRTSRVADVERQAKQVGGDLVNYLVEYARRNPTRAAMYCLGAGFLLGWKLKPW